MPMRDKLGQILLSPTPAYSIASLQTSSCCALTLVDEEDFLPYVSQLQKLMCSWSINNCMHAGRELLSTDDA